MTANPKVTFGRTATEGDELYFEVRGEGVPLLMIAPAGGDGDYYHPLADMLCDVYKVITYDRRANARSTMNYPHSFDISQQSRDAVAVLRAAGESSAVVFGNSSGGTIALDMAKAQPQAVRAVIAHEPPVTAVLPNARKWKRFFAKCYLSSFRWGAAWGAFKFMAGAQINLLNIAKAQKKAGQYAKETRAWEDMPHISVRDGLEYLMKQELLPVTNYMPDIEKIKQNNVKLFIGVGQWAFERKTWSAQASQLLAEKLACPLLVFPGGHGGYMEEPGLWSAIFKEILHKI